MSVTVRDRLASPIGLMLTATECGFAGVVCIASAGAAVVGGCNWRRQRRKGERRAAHQPPTPPEVAEVIALADKRKP
jgi:hypothetical protein